MKAPRNRRVFVVGYSAATPLGKTFETTWQRAVNGEAGFRRLTRFRMESRLEHRGGDPGLGPGGARLRATASEAYNWNAAFVFLTMAVCRDALRRAGLEITAETGPRTACLIGSALNGTDAFRMAMDNYLNRGPLKVSPYLLPNLCANLPAGKAGMHDGLHRADLLPAGGLRLRQPRDRHRGAHDPGRGLRLRARGRGGHLPGPRDHAGIRQHAGHHQRHPAGPGVQRSHPGVAAVQHRPQGHDPVRGRRGAGPRGRRGARDARPGRRRPK